MIEHIHNSNLIENIDDPKEDAQSILAWEYLVGEKELSHGVICKVQKIITLHQTDLQPNQRGYYRSQSKVDVRVGRKVAPKWQAVDALMENYVLDMQDWEHKDPKAMHIQFEHAHPFRDGNGRTGRMLMWWHEFKLGQTPTLISIDERQEYYKWFKTPEEIKAEYDQMIVELARASELRNNFLKGDK